MESVIGGAAEDTISTMAATAAARIRRADRRSTTARALLPPALRPRLTAAVLPLPLLRAAALPLLPATVTPPATAARPVRLARPPTAARSSRLAPALAPAPALVRPDLPALPSTLRLVIPLAASI
jgi:hypothetical protein